MKINQQDALYRLIYYSKSAHNLQGKSWFCTRLGIYWQGQQLL